MKTIHIWIFAVDMNRQFAHAENSIIYPSIPILPSICIGIGFSDLKVSNINFLRDFSHSTKKVRLCQWDMLAQHGKTVLEIFFLSAMLGYVKKLSDCH